MQHIATKKALKNIADISVFNHVLSRATLSESDKRLIKRHYIDDIPLNIVALELNISEAECYDRHRKALQKISKII